MIVLMKFMKTAWPTTVVEVSGYDLQEGIYKIMYMSMYDVHIIYVYVVGAIF